MKQVNGARIGKVKGGVPERVVIERNVFNPIEEDWYIRQKKSRWYQIEYDSRISY